MVKAELSLGQRGMLESHHLTEFEILFRYWVLFAGYLPVDRGLPCICEREVLGGSA